MAEVGANLQNTNNELVKCIEDLRERRAETERLIAKEEEEKARIVHEVQILTDRLKKVDEGLSKKYAARSEIFFRRSPPLLTLIRRMASLHPPPPGPPVPPAVTHP